LHQLAVEALPAAAGLDGGFEECSKHLVRQLVKERRFPIQTTVDPVADVGFAW
jgi:hypothetical protein